MTESDQTIAPDPISALVESGGPPDESLRATLDALPLSLLIFDRAGRLVFANVEAERLARDHSLPSTLSAEFFETQILDPATREPIAGEYLPLSRALYGEAVPPTEYLVRAAHGGEPLWIECAARPLYSAPGSVCGAALTLWDIMPRKERERATQLAGRLQNVVYEGTLAGILYCTLDGRILDCNDALLQMLGYSSKEELLRLRESQLYCDPANRDGLLDELKRAGGHLPRMEVCYKRRDETRCWALTTTSLLEPPAGQAQSSLVSTIVDITERKLGEETLRQSQQRFAAFMRYLPGIAFIKDLSGRYVYYNEASWSQFNRHPEDLLGKTDEEIWPGEDAARYRENDASAIAGGHPVEFLESVMQPDGRHSWLICKFPIVEDGNATLVGGIGVDLTERRVLEEQLVQARKMEALGRLAGGVAHDFNNLLTVISGYGQLALEGAGTTPPARMMTYLQEILNSSRRAAALTGQLLAFSRQQTIQPRVLDLAGLLRNIEHLLQRMIGEMVELKVRYGREPCPIRADAHQIEQVLMNLTVNARDAMPLGGTIEIDCGLLSEPLERPGQEPLSVLLEVRDNGVGMDEAVKAQIFEPFFTSKDKGKGTGLGLSTVYGVISQAGGEIVVQSEPGEGSRFRIYLPLAPTEVEPVAPATTPDAPFGLETVLLVEDEDSVRNLVEAVLKRLGYRVLVADGGQTALELWNEKRDSIDILLTDVIMPQMSGGELAHKLREADPHLKILFMSGYTHDMIASHGALAGETQLIQKPFTAEALARKVRDVLDA